MRYREIMELFDQTIDWKFDINDQNLKQASFSIDDCQYAAQFKYEQDKNINPDTGEYLIPEKSLIWVVSFFMIDDNGWKDYTVNDNGNAFQVFATMKDILSDFIVDIKPNMFKFSSDLREQSRIKLYDRMAKLLTSIYGYDVKTFNLASRRDYYFTKVE